ncbi:transmembrane protein [Mycolicibacterium mageritense DSM 44476 = CIP 104973]|nr:transmembrane protein [Mycolicibacterium mageritense DSM 44476 = CIP 104973]
MTHIGALILWFNQRRVVTGTYAQCDAALRSAQTQNLLVGWWSFLSILIMNWVALVHNVNSRKKLNRDLQQAQAYAQWWHQYHAHTQRHVPPQPHV